MAPPQVVLNSGQKMPNMALGTFSIPTVPAEELTPILVQAIENGYRHFDTALYYRTEQAVGRAVAMALDCGLIKSRAEIFVTSKLCVSRTRPHLVLPTLKETLRNLGLDYVDLYLIHWPVTVKQDALNPMKPTAEEMLHFDTNQVWEAMEECFKLGLAKSIGVSNFSCAKLSKLLEASTIPPAVNQVEMHVAWQQKKLLDYCKEKNIHVCAWSPIGSWRSAWGSKAAMEDPIVKEIAASKKKTTAQVALRWICDQGATPVVKSFSSERMRENMGIFDWKLSDEELGKIRAGIAQARIYNGHLFVFPQGQYKTVQEFWDGEI